MTERESLRDAVVYACGSISTAQAKAAGAKTGDAENDARMEKLRAACVDAKDMLMRAMMEAKL